MGQRPVEFEFEPGKTFRQMCLDAREDQNHPLRYLYEQRRRMSWTGIYTEGGPIDVDTFILQDGGILAGTFRTQGSGGGKAAFAAEMARRIRNDMADPFLTDEERARFASRNDEKVWEQFWDENDGNPPCTYSLDSVRPLESASSK
jgi:hypothetical protein